MSSKLVIFCGVPGSGKTTIARLVARELGNTFHIQTDTLRFMIPRPKYTKEESKLVYDAGMILAREVMKAGYNVILDGTFLKDEYRDEAIRKLAKHYSRYLLVYVACDPETAFKRNLSRMERVPKKSFLRLYEMLEEPSVALRIDAGKTKPRDAARAVLLQL